MCGLGIKLCAVGPILASLYSTSLDTMIYIYITYGIFRHNLSNSGTPNIFTRVYMGTFTWHGVLCVYFLVIVVTPLTSYGGGLCL